MRYMLLIYNDETKDLAPSDPGWDELMAAYGAFTDEVRANGTFVGGDPLQPTMTATTVRVRDGQVLNSDGPFAETKEQLGGFYMLDCRDLDQALELAARIPAAKTGSIEVRPLLEMA